MPNTGKAIGTVLVGIIAIMLAFAGASALDNFGLDTSEVDQEVDTDSDWTSGTLTNVEAVNGSLQLTSGSTTGTYTSEDYEYNETKLTYLKYYTDIANKTNSSATYTVTLYDDTDSLIGSETVTSSETGSLDISSLANETNGDYYDVEIQLDRDTTSVTSPKVDKYTVTKDTPATGIATLGIVVVLLTAIGFVARQL